MLRILAISAFITIVCGIIESIVSEYYKRNHDEKDEL